MAFGPGRISVREFFTGRKADVEKTVKPYTEGKEESERIHTHPLLICRDPEVWASVIGIIIY
jgi:hypothetical protein